MSKAKDENHRFHDVARKIFGHGANRHLHDEDVREITQNLCGFFSILRHWQQVQQKRQHDEVCGKASQTS